MEATKLMINGEVQEIEGKGSTGLPGFCMFTIAVREEGEDVGIISAIIFGEIEDGAILEMHNSAGVKIEEIEIDGVIYDLTDGIRGEYNATGIIRMVNHKIYIMETHGNPK